MELNRRARRQEQLQLEEEEKKKENVANKIDWYITILSSTSGFCSFYAYNIIARMQFT